MIDPLAIIGTVAVMLMVVCIVVRENTNNKLIKKRAQLASLRTQERSLAEKVNLVREAHAQLGEAVDRVQGHQSSTEQLLGSIYERLEQLYEFLRNEELPKPKFPANGEKGIVDEA